MFACYTVIVCVRNVIMNVLSGCKFAHIENECESVCVSYNVSPRFDDATVKSCRNNRM